MGGRDFRVRGRVVLARSLRALGKADAAHEVLAEAAMISPATEDVWVRWELGTALAEDDIARGHAEAARTRLTGVLAEASQLGMTDATLAAEVVLGELELTQPASAAQGRTRLAAAATRAHTVGQRLVELRARAAR
jgi:hypothetical protein